MPKPTRVYSTEAIPLRRMDYGEADRILTLFTPAFGKVRAIAKGARRTTSRLAGHLELFTRTQLLLATGRELDVVTQAEARERLDALRGGVWYATAAWYVSELVERFVEDRDPHPRLYTRFAWALRLLDDLAAREAAGEAVRARAWLALRYFELRLLDELGYRPALHLCAGCDTPLKPEEAGFSAELGGALCGGCSRYAQRRLSLAGLKVLRMLQTTEWEAVPPLRMQVSLERELEGTLQSSLRHHLDRDLKSAAFLHAPGIE
ncbi:MAG: DNA repair protein RecO [Ktedonobacterales bacterium]